MRLLRNDRGAFIDATAAAGLASAAGGTAVVAGDYDNDGRPDLLILRSGGAALYPTSTATTVRVRGGRGGDVVTSDGPYAETKEVLGGFYLLEAADLDEAIALAAKIPGAWGPGAVELRPVIPTHTS